MGVLFQATNWEACYAYSLPMTSAFRRLTDFGNRRFRHKRNSIFTIGRQRCVCFFVPEKGHPYPALAMTGIVTLFKNLAKFGIIIVHLLIGMILRIYPIVPDAMLQRESRIPKPQFPRLFFENFSVIRIKDHKQKDPTTAEF